MVGVFFRQSKIQNLSLRHTQGSSELSRRIENRKWAGLFAIVLALTLVGARAEAQQPKKVRRIGYLSNTDPARESARAEAIRLALRELGYIEGQNIAIDYRYSEGKRDRCPELAAELVRLKVDIIVAGGDPLGAGGQECDQDDSHHYGGLGTDPVDAGLVESLARPGGNVTGITHPFQRPRREAAGAAQRSRSQTFPCRGSLRSGQSSHGTRVEKDSPIHGEFVGVDCSLLGGKSSGRFRASIRFAQ